MSEDIIDDLIENKPELSEEQSQTEESLPAPFDLEESESEENDSGTAEPETEETAAEHHHEGEEEEVVAGVLGENIAGKFSFHMAAKEMGRVMHMPEKVISYIVSVVYLVVGALCIALTHHIEAYLPYIVGSLMAAFAVAQFVLAIVRKEFKNPHANRTASSLIILALSIFIIVESEWGHMLIPIMWGLFGLYEGAHAFNHAMSRIARGLNPAYFIIKGIVEVVVAFLLLYKPEDYGELHIIVFGVSLIFDGITHMPPIKKLLTKG